MACHNFEYTIKFIETVSFDIGETMEASIKNLKIFSCAFEKAAEKLHKCVSKTMGGQPAIKSWKKFVLLICSKRVSEVITMQDYTIIPYWSEVSTSEFDLHIQRLAPTAVSVAGGL